MCSYECNDSVQVVIGAVSVLCIIALSIWGVIISKENSEDDDHPVRVGGVSIPEDFSDTTDYFNHSLIGDIAD